MAKQRTKIPEDIANEVRWLSDDTCCICHEKGKDIQLHHIDEDPQNHVIKNLAVLCLECHNKTQKRGGFTRRLIPSYVTLSRNEWLKTVDFRRKESTKIDIERRTGGGNSSDLPKNKCQNEVDYSPKNMLAEIFIELLPKIRENLLQQFDKRISKAVTTLDMVNAGADYLNALISILVILSDFYHPEYFEDLSPKEFFLKTLSERDTFHAMVVEPHGAGTEGTIRSTLYMAHRIQDIEDLIETMVGGLVCSGFGSLGDFDYSGWRQLWRE